MSRPPHLIRAFAILLLAGLAARADEPPSVSHASGLYDRPLLIQLKAPESTDAYYTTDGTGPGSRSVTRYTGPISITTTTVLRAWSVAPAGTHSPITTRTILFSAEVPSQTGANLPATWGVKNEKPIPAAYTLSGDILSTPAAVAEFARGLRAIPTLSLVVDPADLFGADAGLYSHPEEKGRDWERRASIEFLPADGRPAVSRDCGLRIHGGWGRRPEESPKHAFRLLFAKGNRPRADDVFSGGRDKTELTTLILRSGNNNTFLHPSPDERRRAEYARDQWMRDTHAAMGHPAARGVFVHLYLNGLYWGVYNLTERPDAAFAAAAWGGKKNDYDAQRADKALAGDKSAWDGLLKLADADLSEPAGYAAVARRLDLGAFIDFMILNLYGGNGDWDGASNWYAARDRSKGEEGRFEFLCWDAERTLESIDTNVVDYDAAGSPPRLFQRLRKNADFRLAFADRAWRHLVAPGGALTPAPAAARYRALSDPLDGALVGESVRWGAYRRDVHPFRTAPFELYTRDAHVRPEVDRLLHDYFPRRTAVLLQQLRAAKLYPAIDAPVLRVENHLLYLDAPADATVYFTTDNTDPRAADARVSPVANTYQSPLAVGDAKHVKARVKLREEWSALAEFEPARHHATSGLER